MHLKQKLNIGESLVGTMLNLVYNPDIARIYAEVGFDYFIIDCEHAAYSFREINHIVSVAKNGEIKVLVRIPQVDRAHVQRLLDIGVEGFMIPGVQSAETMAEVVRLAKFPPHGERGVGGGIVQDFRSVDIADWIQKRNEEIFVMAQIEHRFAVNNIDSILSVAGVDAVIFGPRDLSCDLGVLGQIDHPSVLECYETVYQSAERHSVAKGFFCGGDVSGMRWCMERGAQVLLWSGDVNALIAYLSSGVKAIRAMPGFRP
jgi:2-dehydro-3-deoxyglucarate aldolase/4-hydroxy-2-oxoheptanedioate aldolase